jgi:NTE family protein
MEDGKALILGGGGIAGIAWLTGLFTGFADLGLDLVGADLIVGTSAGACVAAQITSGLNLNVFFSQQVNPDRQVSEPLPDEALVAEAASMRPYLLEAGDAGAIRRRRGAFALGVKTIPEAARRAIIAARLPVDSWPAHPLKLVAVDANTGEAQIFDRDSGVSLVDAVAASSAVPGVWPTTTIAGRRYTDGAVRSPENADLAAGFGTILVISPVGEDFAATPPRDLQADVKRLADAGSRVLLLQPDAASREAMSSNLLDPTTRAPAAKAGRVQGRALASDVAAFWKNG